MGVTFLNSPTANSINPTVNRNTVLQSTALLELSTGTRLVYPSSDPAAAAMNNVTRSCVAVLKQAYKNADQGAALTNVASSCFQDLIDCNGKGQVLCAQVINGSLDDESRAIAQQSINAMFGPNGSTEAIIKTCRFGDKPLLNGGETKVTAVNTTAPAIPLQVLRYVIPAGAHAVALAAGANTNPVPAGTLGFIEGEVKGCKVTPGGAGAANTLDIEMTVGMQTFVARDVADAAGTVWNLKSSSGSVITLTGGTGAPTPAALEAALKNSFMNPGGAGIFRTGSVTQTVGAAAVTVTASPGVDPGVYGIGVYTPTGGALTVVVSNGIIGEEILAPAAAGPVAVLGGRITLTFGAAPAALANYQVNIENKLNLSFQTGSQPTDLTEVSLPKVSLNTLNYVDMDVTTIEKATETTEKLKKGMKELNDINAQIGAAQQRLMTAGSNAEKLEENMKNAGATYSDANPITSMIDLQMASILLDNAISSTLPAMAPLKITSGQVGQVFRNVS